MKVLIWDMFELHNTGGPSGYLYNIHEYLSSHPVPQIVFLSDILGNHKEEDTVKDSNSVACGIEKEKLRSSILKRIWHGVLSVMQLTPKIKSYITKTIDYSYRAYHIQWKGIKGNINLSEYDYIHFHMLLNLRQFKNTFPEYKGKTIFTSHCPCPWTDEMIDFDRDLRFLRPIMIRQECKTYQCADYIMFPCSQAKEPYEHNRIVNKTLGLLENRTFYVPTSIISDPTINPQTIKRSDYNIPEFALVIGFFGRHNYIKGYDILKQIGQEVLDNHPDIYFLCASAGDIKPLNHPRWRELGYISNVHEIMRLCDMYVLPNRETYFDLVAIEALRAGMVLSMSDTGGNRYFHTLPDYETKGIYHFDKNDITTPVKQIESLCKMKKNNVELFNELKTSNRILYEHYFTTSKYIDSYIEAVARLA